MEYNKFQLLPLAIISLIKSKTPRKACDLFPIYNSFKLLIIFVEVRVLENMNSHNQFVNTNFVIHIEN